MPKNKTLNFSVEVQQNVEQFLYKQADILDERNWEAWLELFTNDGKYWMPAHPEGERHRWRTNPALMASISRLRSSS